MFDQFKAMGAIASLMKDKDRLKEAGDRIKEHLENATFTSTAGSGAASATVTGTMRIVSVDLEPALIAGMAADDKTRDLASSLIAEALNNALALARQEAVRVANAEAQSLGLPEIPADVTGLLG